MKKQTDYIQDALDTAYWAHIMGDELQSRQLLYNLIKFLDKEGPYESSSQKKETHEEEYLIR